MSAAAAIAVPPVRLLQRRSLDGPRIFELRPVSRGLVSVGARSLGRGGVVHRVGPMGDDYAVCTMGDLTSSLLGHSLPVLRRQVSLYSL